MKILISPDPTLRKVAQDVKKYDKKLEQQIKEMTLALKSAQDPEGVGLAATQVGILKRFFLLNLHNQIECFINPELVEQSEAMLSDVYKKKKDRREYVRVALRRGSDGEIEAVKHPQDGAGILTSLTETDGLLEFPEDVTSIAPGERVGARFRAQGERLHQSGRRRIWGHSPLRRAAPPARCVWSMSARRCGPRRRLRPPTATGVIPSRPPSGRP